MSSIRYLFYVSKVVQPLSDASIQSILRASRRNNAKLDMTGCLLYSGKYFAQVLEGNASTVAATADRISLDPRHTDVRVLTVGTQATRRYGSWSMGFLHDLNFEDALESLLSTPELTPQVLDALKRMQPDSMMGALA